MPGPNAVIGVNGSGKTTFISIALHCLTGPFNLPSATSSTELGQVRPRAIPMSREERRQYGARVADSAQHATATLTVSFGERKLEIKRNLSDLSLVSLRVNRRPVTTNKSANEKTPEDASYQAALSEAVGVASMFDVLIILRFLVFMMENRRALVWDPTAQRQIFRVLLLSPEQATEYASAQQEVISADSAVRNTNALIYRQQGQKVKAARRAQKIVDSEAERRVLTAEANALREKTEELAQLRIEADNERRSARRERLKATEARENTVRELERLKMEALGHRLGPDHQTVKYIIGQPFDLHV